MSEYTPTTDEVIRSFSIPAHRVVERKDGESFADYLSRASIEGHKSQMESEAAARRWLTQVRAEAAAEALTKLATHLDGGTPRAWGFHHPCDPPGKRWEPDETDRALMMAADIAREQAARALADKETP